MGARRQHSAQEAYEASQEDAEDEVTTSGLRYYWSKPWELKSRFLAKVQELRGVKRSSIVTEEDGASWELDTLLFLPAGEARSAEVLKGNPHSLPEYQAVCARSDADAKD